MKFARALACPRHLWLTRFGGVARPTVRSSAGRRGLSAPASKAMSSKPWPEMARVDSQMKADANDARPSATVGLQLKERSA